MLAQHTGFRPGSSKPVSAMNTLVFQVLRPPFIFYSLPGDKRRVFTGKPGGGGSYFLRFAEPAQRGLFFYGLAVFLAHVFFQQNAVSIQPGARVLTLTSGASDRARDLLKESMPPLTA